MHLPLQVMHADRFRLTQQLRRLNAEGLAWDVLSQSLPKLDGLGKNSGCVDAESSRIIPLVEDAERSRALERWQQSLQQSMQVYQKRDQSVPNLEYDSQLPITAHRQEIIDLLQSRQTLVICGETGSGKSTQLPKLCLDAGLGRAGMIGHTQPRRLAARAVASRLAQELDTQLGDLVGFKIRFSDATSSKTLVKVMTDGVLLAETQSDRFLEQYDVLIIDEAHERSLNIDFLLGYLRRIQAKRPELKLIITSATIDPQKFANHFSDSDGPAPILEVSGRTFPVEILYRPVVAARSSTGEILEDEDLYRAIALAVDELWTSGVPAADTNAPAGGSRGGDILVFLPTERDIRLASKALRGHFAGQRAVSKVEILPLYARLSQAEQNKIFASHSGQRVVLATNVAESSLTVPGIRFVIDSGLVRLSRYASRSKVQRLPIEPISQASANQRSGRCGRLGPGICIRLYEEADFQNRPHFTTPEIRRSDLANVLLQSHMLRLGPLEEFPLLDSPPPESIRDAQRTLRELGATDAQHHLTELGKQLGRLPCDVRVARMLLEAHARNCLAEVILIAAALETTDVRQRPAGQSAQADAAHQRFQDPHSDFLSLIRLWDFYENLCEQLGRSRLQKALQQQFLSHHGFREWADIIRQLKELLGNAGFSIGHRRLALPAAPQSVEGDATIPPRPEGYAAIHQSLLAGLLSGIAEKDQQRFEYKAAGGLGVRLWPGSGLFRQSPKWIVAAEIVETSQRYARTVAGLDVEWIEHAGKDLLKHTYHDPFWSEKSGAAMVYRKSTLYGLTVVSGRRTPLSTINSTMARDMLIEHGLVEGKWHCQLPFYQHNLEMLADMEELVKRTRSRQYVVDRYSMMQFYSSRLPESICDLNGLQSWIAKHRGSAEERSLWLRPEDLLEEGIGLDVAAAFPNTLQQGATEFPLSYHFEPGHERDGVTISIPQIGLRQVSEESLGWLVPGLLEEKVLAIIRALPKSIRTNFVPAPDVAKKLAEQLAQCDRTKPFSKVLADLMSRHSGQTISSAQISDLKLPEQTRFRIQVLDDVGNVLATSRDIHDLVSRFGISPESASQLLHRQTLEWSDRIIRCPEDLDGLPEEISVNRGGIAVAAYVAIVDAGKTVEARLVDTREEARRLSRAGFVRLFALKNERSLRSQVKHLPQWNSSALALGSIMDSGQWQQALQDLIVRVALLEEQEIPRGSVDFTARQTRAASQIAVASQEVAEWLPKLAAHFQQLRLALEKAPESWKEVTLAVRDQISGLLCPGFVSETPWRWLKEYPRYLQAAKMRLEKLAAGGLAKDRKLAEPLVAVRNALKQLTAQQTAGDEENLAAIQEIRWALEELQVSLFAQQLGTKISVSAKRIQEMLNRAKM